MPVYYKDQRKESIKKSLFLIVLFLITFFTSAYLLDKYQRNEMIKSDGILTICGLDYKESIELINQQDQDDTYLISDYLYYGETLNLFNSVYDIKSNDDIIGRTIILKNLCTGDELVYLINGKIDSQIPVETLVDGFYSINIVYDLIQRSAYSKEIIDNTFYTVRRNETSKRIRLIANKEVFGNDEISSDQQYNYLYLEVQSNNDDTDVYDIVIDPGHSSTDTGNYVEYGGKANGLIEAEETYKIALVIKDELEKYGLKVLITRNDETEVVDTYGENGRLYRAYQVDAKYYFDLQMRVASNPNIKGTQIVHSSFTSNKMATAIFNYLVDNTDLVSTGYTGSGKIPGVLASGTIDGYDGRMVIRESGGRILEAGTFSELAQQENASFAKNERNGLQTFTIEYIYLTNPDEAKAWQENYQEYGKKTAEAILSYLNVIE